MTQAQVMTLGELVSPWCDISAHAVAQLPVRELQLDSRKVTPGTVFVAIQGHAMDGRQFISAATQSGASAVIAQADEQHAHGDIIMHQPSDVPILYLNDLNQHLSALAMRLYPLASNQLIAVTGTNGKTTISQLIAQWLELLGRRAAVMGTTGNGFLANLQQAANTTGNAIEIQQTLSELEQQGAQFTALEVSSHGLVQGRVRNLPFQVGIFSNLSRDHLDYHGTMQEYAKAKMSLFTEHDCQQAVLNIDDQVGAQWISQLPQAIGVSLQPQSDSAKHVYATDVTYSEQGISLSFSGRFGDGKLTAPLIGQFNASNLLLALTTLLALGFNKSDLIDCAGQLKPVIGRMELFQQTGKAKVVVDYAHTPDALEKALSALRVHCQGQLWAIFGCGGDRDAGKRPMMAQIAERLADQVILTDDNPRSEDPNTIITDMQNGLTSPQKAAVEHDRFRALAFALEQASENDIVLLAGKGHEDYQVIGSQTVHYSDRESAAQLLEVAL
ncbi:UDP-N-acetylmuramoylalanyl-D-glutamate--2,6-diaminopimelate ligase [Vibrio xiamenensis]|uniref:UDP-N-acetylmuramoyl-L-alanyl-D-glutamate--2,6-diaminopimelate ligase n=1 Tax=Vibrio xiamenensis TaxID=861298 RepID=A0A1G7VZY2_9VIBR|nr:UDP-N-acetylmuramoyl-L-alanyl-D-glutamate--2,6-diaminopimelate ligase [Vibrio xiamenensis]SDG65221.1 UDP-N-acetylmuramoylalanyl-D-glutamate--2,6-diaminopimelate ligase [Vibrio xiamenensis]